MFRDRLWPHKWLQRLLTPTAVGVSATRGVRQRCPVTSGHIRISFYTRSCTVYHESSRDTYPASHTTTSAFRLTHDPSSQRARREQTKSSASVLFSIVEMSHSIDVDCWQGTGKVDVRLPVKGDSKSHGARPVHPIITAIKWIWTSRLSIKNSLPRQGTD